MQVWQLWPGIPVHVCATTSCINKTCCICNKHCYSNRDRLISLNIFWSSLGSVCDYWIYVLFGHLRSQVIMAAQDVFGCLWVQRIIRMSWSHLAWCFCVWSWRGCPCQAWCARARSPPHDPAHAPLFQTYHSSCLRRSPGAHYPSFPQMNNTWNHEDTQRTQYWIYTCKCLYNKSIKHVQCS